MVFVNKNGMNFVTLEIIMYDNFFFVMKNKNTETKSVTFRTSFIVKWILIISELKGIRRKSTRRTRTSNNKAKQ